jgi:tetratricopeptide (TPR) repeat protein
LGREAEGYDALYKATWNYAWQSAAFLGIARLDCKRGEWGKARGHLEKVLAVNDGQLQARNLLVVVLRKMGLAEEARAVLAGTLKMDGLDWWARELNGEELGCDGQVLVDVALEYGRAGLYREGLDVIERWEKRGEDGERGGRGDARDLGVGPLLTYLEGWLWEKAGDGDRARAARMRAGPMDYCFPARLEELEILLAGAAAEARDWKVRYLLGNWMYDRRRHEEAIEWWEGTLEVEKGYSVVWRNLGIGYFNVERDSAKAREAYERAFTASMAEEDGGSGRIFYERDQLWKRVGASAAERLAEMEKHRDLVGKRDDLSVEYASLLNELGRFAEAARVLAGRRFQPWEGGEGLALGQHVAAQIELGRAALERGDARGAVEAFRSALQSPGNLGEAKHLLANQSEVHYWLGKALVAAGDEEGARREWAIAAEASGDFREMSVRAYSELSVYSALAMRELGREAEAERVLRGMFEYGEGLQKSEAKIDYFATSLPTMLLFEEDLQERQRREGERLCALAVREGATDEHGCPPKP